MDKFDKAVIGLVIELKDDEVTVDIGGITLNVLSPFEDVKVGDLVLIHEGFILKKIDKDDLRKDIDSLEGIR